MSKRRISGLDGLSPRQKQNERGFTPSTHTPSDYSPIEIGDDFESDVECVPTCFTKSETFLFFDWDDTLLPSSWIQEEGLKLNAEAFTSFQRASLKSIVPRVTHLLRVAKRFGTVVILTNAERGWVELSCQRYLPELLPILESIKIISARSTYETKESSSPFEWKLRAFGTELTKHFFKENRFDLKAARRNVISFGDSCQEREAVLRSTAMLSNCRVKSVKFMEHPSCDRLVRQLTLVEQTLELLVHHNGNLDICLDSI